jgi:hypothetical protein
MTPYDTCLDTRTDDALAQPAWQARWSRAHRKNVAADDKRAAIAVRWMQGKGRIRQVDSRTCFTKEVGVRTIT